MDLLDILLPKTKKAYQSQKNNPPQGMDRIAMGFGPILGAALSKRYREEMVPAGLEVSSYAIPFGKGANFTQKFIAPGAMSGALQSLSESNDVGNLAQKSASSALMATLFGAAGNAAGKMGSKLTNEVPERLMNSVLKEPMKAFKASVQSGETLGKMALDRGVKGISDKALLESFQGKIKVLEDTLTGALKGSLETIKVDELTKKVQPLINKYAAAGNISDVNAITSRIAALKQFHGENMPVAAANEVKRTLYEEVGNKYGSQASEGIEGLKSIARALKESIAKVPGVNEINKELGFNGRMRDSLVDKMARGGRNNLSGLGDTILAAGGGVSAIPAIIGKNVLGSTGGKTMIANILNQTGKAVGNSGIPEALTQILGITGAKTGQAVSNSVMKPAQDTQEDPNQYRSTNSPLNHMDQSISQNVNNGIQDGALSPEGQWRFDSKVGDWIPNEGGESQQQGGISREKIGQAMLMDLLQNGGKNIPELKAIAEFAVPEEATQKTKLVAGEVAQNADIESSINLMKTLGDTGGFVDKYEKKLGPIRGRLNRNPYDTDAQAFDAQMRLSAQVVGKALEGGVLRKEDEEKYRRILPQITDTPEVARKKIEAVKKQLEDKLRSRKSEFEKTGYSMDGGGIDSLQNYLGINLQGQ